MTEVVAVRTVRVMNGWQWPVGSHEHVVAVKLDDGSVMTADEAIAVDLTAGNAHVRGKVCPKCGQLVAYARVV